MARRPIILKAGSKIPTLAGFAGDYEDWIVRGMGLSPGGITVIPCSTGVSLPPLEEVAAVVITGSASMITEQAPWMVAGGEWLREAVLRSVPLLGICFGHQWLAQACGGEVGYNPRGVEVGTAVIRLTDAARSDPLFSALPPAFPAQTTHRQTVLKPPAGATLLAASELDGCQAFRLDARAWGVQFHPEFEAAMMGRFIDHFREGLLAEGKSPEALTAAVVPSPDAAGLLARFARVAGLVC